MTHTVLGLCDDGNHVELHNTDSHDSAKAWIRGYTVRGDWGGYYGLAVIDEAGEWLSTWDKPDD